jgi:transcription termination factor NusB
MEGLKIGHEARSYSEAIVKGVISNTPMIDGLIEEYSENWTVARMLVHARSGQEHPSHSGL